MTTPQHNEHHATTTEELIVQYLDGELVRKELEGVLFERLARSEDARLLLREHLMLRGAIRSTMEHETFQLSADLDQRTRSRIEEMLRQGTNIPGVIATAPERAPIATNPATRRLAASVPGKRWAMRPAYAALLLLLTVGTTWYLTRSTTSVKVAGPSTALNRSAPQTAPQPSATQSPDFASQSPDLASQSPDLAPQSAPEQQAATTPAIAKNVEKQPAQRTIVKYVQVPTDMSNASHELAQNAPSVTPARQAAEKQQAEPSDPADIMISHRYAKLLNATAKREVIVSGKDRL